MWLYPCTRPDKVRSLMQAWYLTYGRSRGQTIFLASSILVGHVFPSGRRSCQNPIISSKLVSLNLCFSFISIALSVTFNRVSSVLHPSYNGVTVSFSSCASLDFSLAAALALLVCLRRSSCT